MHSRDPQKLGATQTSLQPSWRIPIIRHFVHAVMSSQKTLYDLFQPSAMKSSTGQKGKPDRKILRRFWDPRNVFFVANGLNKFNLLTCFPAPSPCNYYTNTRLHTPTQTHTRQSLSNMGTLKKEKGPSVSRKWRSQ